MPVRGNIILHKLWVYIIIVGCLLFFSCFVFASPSHAADLDTNLLQDGGGEEGGDGTNTVLLSNHGWTGGDTIHWYAYTAYDGVGPITGNYFMGYYSHPIVNTPYSYSTYQDVDVSSQAANINAGIIAAQLTGYEQKTGDAAGVVKIGLQAINSTGSSTDLGEYTATVLGSWQPISIREGVPSGTVALRVILTGINIKGGYAAFDDLTLQLKQDTAQPPVISAIADQSNNSGETLGPIEFTISDADTDVSALTVNITSSNQTLIPDANITKAVNAGNCTVSITSAAGNTGLVTITIAVSDGNKTTYQSFTVTVYPNVQVGTELLINGDCSSLNGWQGSDINRFVGGSKFVVSTIPSGVSEIYIYQDINVGKFATPIDEGLLEFNASINPGSTGKIIVQGLNAYGSVIWTKNSGTIEPQTRALRVQVGGALNTWVDDISCLISGENLPKMTALADQSVDVGISKTLPFVIAYTGDIVSLSASSSNTDLVPHANLVFEGSSYSRSITVTPAAGKSGSSVITISSNGSVLETFTLVVNKADQDISGTTAYNKTYGDSEFALDSVAGTEVTYTVASGESIIELTGRTVTIKGVGTATVTASAAADANYNAAGDVTITINIAVAKKPIEVNALVFDGSDDYVVIPDNDDSSSVFTIETWVKWEAGSSSDVQFICGKETEQMEIHTGGDAGTNGLRFIPASGVYLDAVNALPIGVWTHVAAVYDPAAALAKMYINGQEVALAKGGTNPLTTPVSQTSSSFFLGSRVGGFYPFKGSLDEFRIWNRVRSQEEILLDMVNTLDVTAQSGLISYYNLNQGIAGGNNIGLTNLPDLTGNYNGTLTNFALNGSISNWVDSDAWAGLETYIVSYDGNGETSGTAPTDSRQYVEGAKVTAKGAAQLIKTGYTFSGWNTAADGSGTGYAEDETFLISTGNVTLYTDWEGVVVVAAATAGGDALVNSAEKAAGFKVVAQCSEAAGTLYVVPAGTANNIGDISAAAIGSGGSAGAFTDTEITISANNTGVIDATSYRIYAVDGAGKILPISGVAFTADLTTPTENCKSLAYDGSDDYVAISDNDDTISAFTIETWVKWEANSSTDVQFICGKDIEQMEIHTGGGAGANGLRFIPANGVYLDAANVLPTGVWTHVAAVYNPAELLAKMYINGEEVVLINKGTKELTTAVENTSTDFYLGSRGNSIYHFKGSLDEFRIWNRVRSQEEILGGLVNEPDVPDETGLISCYNFNQGLVGVENTGLTNLPDLTGNYHGTLNNFALIGNISNWVTGNPWAGLNLYNVSYDGNGAASGTVPTDNLNYLEGAPVTVKEHDQLAKTGYAFAGWNTAADGSGSSYDDGSTFHMGTESVILYAQWCLVIYRGAQLRGFDIDSDGDFETYDIRFLATIDTLDADAVGFVFSKSEENPRIENVPSTQVKSTTTVYHSITAAGSSVTASSLGGSYIIACAVTGIPETDVDTALYVRAFATKGTETTYTPVKTVTVNGLKP